MAKRPKIKVKAFTIIELVIAISILAVILASSGVIFKFAIKAHRTAGAMHKIINLLEEVAAGDYEVTLRLRQNDTLRSLEDPFNKMTASLKRHAQEDARSMTRLADEISEHGNPVDAEMLRRISDAKTRRLS